MAEITAALVKQLRDKTGAGMMDAKKALVENNGDIEASADWLREKGILKAAKKADRIAAEGLIGVASNGKAAALVEVNSETDFVARNEGFQKAVREVAELGLANNGDVVKLAHATSSMGGTVNEMLQSLVATIGENMTLRRAAAISVNEGVVATYIHNQAADGMGKIGVLVALESAAATDKLEALGKQLAMHVAAAFPIALDESGVSAETIERERAIAQEKAAESGKPAEVVAKMVDGAVAKFLKENTLINQLFVIDGKTKISDVVAAAGKEAGSPIVLKDYVRFQLGEGIEKVESDFAAEVAAAAGL